MMNNLSLENFENGIKVYQYEDLYKFTSDSINLAKFCRVKHTDNVLDMCAGCGVVGFYAYSINNFNKIYFNEIQPKMCDLIKKNAELNLLTDKCEVLCKDLNELTRKDFVKPLDVIVCNPPYFKVNGKIKDNKSVAICRHEIKTNLKQVINKSSELIKSLGKFYLVIPAERFCECIVELNRFGFKQKRIKIFYSKDNAKICLIESVKGAKSGVVINIEKI